MPAYVYISVLVILLRSPSNSINTVPARKKSVLLFTSHFSLVKPSYLFLGGFFRWNSQYEAVDWTGNMWYVQDTGSPTSSSPGSDSTLNVPRLSFSWSCHLVIFLVEWSFLLWKKMPEHLYTCGISWESSDFPRRRWMPVWGHGLPQYS